MTGRLWRHTRVQRNEFREPHGSRVVGKLLQAWEAPLLDVACEHFVSGVPSTVMGQTQLGNGATGTWRLAVVVGQSQLRNGASGTSTLR